MSINSATSSVSAASQVSASQSAEVSQKNTSSDTSFKDEMDKVSASQEKEAAKDNDVKKSDEQNNEKISDKKSDDKPVEKKDFNEQNNQNPEALKAASLSMIDVNNKLSLDIAKMIDNSELSAVNQMAFDDKSLISLDFTNSISMTEDDAMFFVNLTKNDNVSAQNVISQAQNMLNFGADVSNVQKNVNISQTLLDAIAKAKDTNQPLRIDFDQNVAVILRISKDGTLAANFIPGDKAVEKYLKDNIESLRNAFDEAELPYSDLSYQSRGSKHQKQRQQNR